MMHLSKSALFSVFIVLLSSAPVLAFAPALHLGSLKPQGSWKVAAVDTQDSAAYCAMTNHFDRETVLSFLSNAEDRDSIAFSFGQNLFQPGMEYGVFLRAENAGAGSFSGQAVSENSIVVQIGKDGKFFKSLNKSPRLEVALPGMDATFDLQSFSSSAGTFRTCAGELHQGPKVAAVPVGAVEKISLAPLDGVQPTAPVVEVVKETAAVSVAAPVVAPQKSVIADRSLALLRQRKVLKAALTAQKNELQLKNAIAVKQPAPVLQAAALPARQESPAPETQAPLKKIASISSGETFDSLRVRTAERELLEKQADLKRQALAQQKRAEWLQSEKMRLAVAVQSQPAKPVVAVPVQQQATALPKKENPPLQDKKDDLKAAAASLGMVEPAAGGKTVSSMSAPSVPSPENREVQQTGDFLNNVMAYHLAPEKKTDDTPLSLDTLLKDAGIAVNGLVPPPIQMEDSAVSRWTFGKISGLYEQAAISGDFRNQVGAYIARYHQDCGKKLKVHLSPAEIIGAGTLAVAEVECTMPKNAYVSSFIFLEDNGGFKAILHTSYPIEKTAVQDVGGKLVRQLKTARVFEAFPPTGLAGNPGTAVIQ